MRASADRGPNAPGYTWDGPAGREAKQAAEKPKTAAKPAAKSAAAKKKSG